MNLKFDPAERARLESAERAKEYDIPGIIASIGLEPGMSVVDIGAGTGFFSIPFSKAVGPMGKVIAVDISREMLDEIDSKISKMHIANIETVLSTEDKIPLATSSVDMAFMCNVLHELDGESTLKELTRILKPSGRFAVIDWAKKREPQGPPYEHRLSKTEALEKCTRTGLVFLRYFPTGSDSRYGLLFRKSQAQA